MSRRGLAVAGVAGAIGVAVVAGALLLAGGDDDGGAGGGDKDPVAAGASTTTTTAAPAEDPLCVAHDQLVAAVEPLGPIDGPAHFEAFATAQLAFTTTAAGIEPAAFRPMADYWGQVRDFYGGRGWDQQVDLADAALVPRPPATDAAGAVLADRCGVTAPVDVAP